MKLFLTKALTILVLIMVGLVEQGQGQVPGQACGSTFFGALVQLIPCRGAVAPFSMLQPTLACCNAIKALGQPCLCVLINGPPITGIDRGMALQLPSKCAANFEPCTIGK